MSQNLSLPTLAATEVTVLNRLVKLSHELFSKDFLPAQLLPYFSTSSIFSAKTRLILQWSSFSLYLYLDTSLSTLTTFFLPEDLDLSPLEEDITLALFEKTLLANYAKFLDIPLHLKKIEDANFLPENCYVLQWQPGHPTLRGQLYIPRDDAHDLSDKLTQAVDSIAVNMPPPPGFVSTLPIPVCMTLGEMNLSMREIRQLEKFDLLLPEKSYFTGGIMQLQLSNSLGFTIKVENNICTVITSLESYKTHMNNNENDFDDDFKKFLEDIPDNPYEHEDLIDESESDHTETIESESGHAPHTSVKPGQLEEVEVRLTFDVGHLQFTLGELVNITPGYTFNLGKNIHKAVTIRANGTMIGKGELVDIEGTLGVSIVEIYQRGQGE